MTYSELKSLGIGPIGVRTMILNGHKKLLLSRSQANVIQKTEKRRGSEGSSSSSSISSSLLISVSQNISNTPSTTPKNLKTPSKQSAASQLFENFSKMSSISDSPESTTNNSRLTPPLTSIPQIPINSIQPQIHISGNIISVAISKPLGMTLSENVPDEPLGVHIEKITSDGNAARCGVLKSGYILRDLCGKEALEMEFDDIMEILREAPFDIPLEMVFIDPTKTSDGKTIELIEETEIETEDKTSKSNNNNNNNDNNNDEQNETGDSNERESFDFDAEVEVDFEGDEDEKIKSDGRNMNNNDNRRILLRRKSSLT
mmetsp:Transcript_15010/g.15744  ORF Transcript_15010/g.15744 Transcript_15010/m.15744 type:complete len:316 (+) Transcript_15010:1208-2155(+)